MAYRPRRHGFRGCQRLARGCGWNEALGVLTLHPLGPLEIQKMLQRLVTKRQQIQLDRRREVTRPLREVGSSERGRGADCRGQVGDQRQVQHLLDRDAVQRLAPPIDNLCLLGGETFVGALFEAKLRKQVLAHDHVLELRGFRQQPPHIFAVGDDDPGLQHATPPSTVLRPARRHPPRRPGRSSADQLTALSDLSGVRHGPPTARSCLVQTMWRRGL